MRKCTALAATPAARADATAERAAYLWRKRMRALVRS
jgi:hypothetical protein